MYVLIPFGVPVHAEGAGIIPVRKIAFSTVLVCTGFGTSMIARDVRNREFHGILRHGNGIPREIIHFHGKTGWERDIKISSGTVWMGSRERYLHGNGKKTVSREILEEISRGNFFSRGNFPEEGLGK